MIIKSNFVVLIFRNIKTEVEKIVYIHFYSMIYTVRIKVQENQNFLLSVKVYRKSINSIEVVSFSCQLLKIIIRQEILFDAPYPSLYSLQTFSLKHLFRNCREFENFTLHVQQRPEFHLTEISLAHLWLYKFTIFQWVKLSSLNEDLRHQILSAKLLLRSN